MLNPVAAGFLPARIGWILSAAAHPEGCGYKIQARCLGEFGVSWARVIHPTNVAAAERVRPKCQYGCGAYGTCLTCPPYSPVPEYTRKMPGQYSKAIILVHEEACHFCALIPVD